MKYAPDVGINRHHDLERKSLSQPEPAPNPLYAHKRATAGRPYETRYSIAGVMFPMHLRASPSRQSRCLRMEKRHIIDARCR